MALLDLSRVTTSLINLLERNIPVLEPGLTPTVSPRSPDQVAGEGNTLSLYLYHVGEEAYYKNQPGPGTDVPDVAKNPMALCLYYILTAHHDSDTSDGALVPQHLMGLALKTLHDFPVLTDGTVVGGQPVLDDAIRGEDNDLQILMRPVSPEESITFWTTEEQQATRLAAYYEVRVVMLEPEEPRTMPGRVLSLGTFLVEVGAPSFERSRNLLRFDPPASLGGGEQAVESSPARVSLSSGGPPGSPHNRVELVGTNLSIGRSRNLFLRSARWIRDGIERAALDPALNPGWNLQLGTDRLSFDVQAQLQVDDGAGGAVPLDLLPGVYSAELRVVKDEAVIRNQLKQITVSSNEVVFLVGLRIASHGDPFDGPVPGTVRVTVHTAMGFDLTSAEIQESLQVVVGGRVYTRVTEFQDHPTEPELDDATFVVLNESSLVLQPHFDVSIPAAHAFHLSVNGAESQPFWIDVP